MSGRRFNVEFKVCNQIIIGSVTNINLLNYRNVIINIWLNVNDCINGELRVEIEKGDKMKLYWRFWTND